MRRGWEFWLGAGFVVAAIGLIAPAFLDAEWRAIVSSMGSATAAFAVVGASLIAYDGALAKVRYDRSIEIINRRRREVSFQAKFRLATSQVVIEGGEVKSALKALEDALPYYESKAGYPDDYEYQEPREFEEIWNNLDRVPAEAINGLGVVRLRFAQYARLLAGYRQMATSQSISEEQLTDRRDELRIAIDEIVAAATRAREKFDGGTIGASQGDENISTSNI